MRKKVRTVSVLLAGILLMSSTFAAPIAAGQGNGEGQNNLPKKGQVIDNLPTSTDISDLDLVKGRKDKSKARDGNDEKVIQDSYHYTDAGDTVHLLVTATPANSTVFTSRSRRDYINRFGVVVARHWANTQWTADGMGTMLSSPRSLWSDEWTHFLYHVTAKGASWNWYRTGFRANAQSNIWATFASGIPTPWGLVAGMSLTSRCITTVNGFGGSTAVWFP